MEILVRVQLSSLNKLGGVAEWLRRRIANPDFTGSNPVVVSIKGVNMNLTIERA